MKRRFAPPLRRPRVYRALIAKRLGRPLRPTEVVHHINGDYTDNRLDNLLAVTSQSAHMLIHHYERRAAAGVQHLFPLISVLHSNGDEVLWATSAAYEKVFESQPVSAGKADVSAASEDTRTVCRNRTAAVIQE